MQIKYPRAPDKPAASEQQVQKAVFQHLKVRSAANVFSFHCPNGGFRRPIEASIMTGLGVRPGVPDLVLVREGRAYFLELKSSAGKLSDRQREVIELLEKAGAVVAVAYSLDDALEQLESWGILRGKSS